MKRAWLQRRLNTLFQAPGYRKNRLYTFLNQLALDYHHAFENHDFNFATNGEERLLQHLGAFLQNPVVFDVGANRGEWSMLALKHFNIASLHAFELCPQTFHKLKQNLTGKQGVYLNDFGLSNREESVSVLYSPSCDVLSSVVANVMQVADVETIPGSVRIGQNYCRETAVEQIDFLKIDVEGMEQKVLEGFTAMLSEQRIRIIQLEYGMINVCTQFLLKSIHTFFAQYDYQVGKLYRRHIDFVAYEYTQENFLGPNYIAVRKKDRALLDFLQQRWG